MKNALLLAAATANPLFYPPALSSSPNHNSILNDEVKTSTQHSIEVPISYTEPSPNFNLRYHVDSSCWDGSPEAPIFVSMGGEGPANSASCSSDAKDNSAICVQVEHRFYGESLPGSGDGGASTLNYRAGLSVEANAMDTEAVIAAVQNMFPVQNNNSRPVMNFGGSYSGGTCTW